MGQERNPAKGAARPPLPIVLHAIHPIGSSAILDATAGWIIMLMPHRRSCVHVRDPPSAHLI
ncbi:hypothetical protein PVAP13_7NG147617 [Panicum virgatum]|uniref:Uncharacterized protein n=1 Tax=Panicum virgatum TaxID=38727 RepID=A0A8T0PZV4_PANVG|nr:hypothetical protein PVAP13_7NG147617 [Panicum virgatum]